MQIAFIRTSVIISVLSKCYHMSDFIDVNPSGQVGRGNAVSWFNAISAAKYADPIAPAAVTHTFRANATGPAMRPQASAAPGAVGSPEANDLTASTICYVDESCNSFVKKEVSSISGPPAHTDDTVGGSGCSNFFATVQESALEGRRAVTKSSEAPKRQRRCDDMYEEAIRGKLAKSQWAAAEQLRKTMLEKARFERDCTFRPQLSFYAARLKRPTNLSPENRIYEELMRRNEWRAQKQKEHIENELKDCTFRPITMNAAQLKSSAHAHDSHIFSELYNHNDELKYFYEEIQPQVVDQLTRQLHWKNMDYKVIPRGGINAVVDRLFAQGAIVQKGQRRSRSAGEELFPFKPLMNPESERIVSKQLEAGLISDDVMERLVNEPPAKLRDRCKRREYEEKLFAREFTRLRTELKKEMRASLDVERRKAFISAKFDAIVSLINREDPRYLKFDSRRVKYPITLLLKAAVDALTPDEGEELVHILSHSRSSKLNKKGFVSLCERAVQLFENPNSSALVSVPPPPPPNVADRHDPKSDEIRRKMELLRWNLSPEQAATIRAQGLERQRRRLEEEAVRRRANEEEEMKECTFRPQPARKIPNECRSGRYTDVRVTRAEMLRRAHIQKTQRADTPVVDLPVPLAKELFGKCNEKEGKVSPPTEKQQRSPSSLRHLTPNGKFRQIRTTLSMATPQKESPRCTNRAPTGPKRKGVTGNLGTNLASSFGKKKRTAANGNGNWETSDAAAMSDDSSQEAAAIPTDRTWDVKSEASLPLTCDLALQQVTLRGDGALTDLGRELILKQLREYRRSRR
uniref:Uncharacterized protein n=1 Tax=Trypanosoma congolense (strain IL3000) TaxID=1068625 RepID=G0UZB5_TRYCI|nr:conserved hypothetical protein [Trypanosoma congolense IL3000]